MYGYPLYNTAPHTHKPSTIEVYGQGEVSAAPDQAVIVLGALTEGPVLNVVQTENARIVTDIINSLLKLGIPREHIQTDEFRIEPRYDYQEGQQIFRGYKVTHLLKITTDRVGQTGTIVDTAVSQGANIVSSIRFTTARPDIYENKALSIAVQNAWLKASTIARTLGVSLAAVPLSVEEISRSEQPIPYKAALLASSAVTPIQPGELTIMAAVKAVYLIA